MIDKIGEVVYTRVIPDVRNNNVAELVLFNDGNCEECGGFAVREPFTSIGTCNDFVFEFNDNLYTITSIYKFKSLENKLAMFKLLGIL